MTSRPVWGAWIEITAETMTDEHQESRAPYGARGLKFGISLVVVGRVSRRAPYGARGLKCSPGVPMSADIIVAPRMGRVD